MDQSIDSEDREFTRHFNEQIAEILSAFNRWVTGEKVGHNPDDNELLYNYVISGGAKNLAIKNGRDVKGADL